ncbi:MAG: Rpn family recombination-promoting nuclease/putative transposase [Selenomonadaceae bacterium]|nr:Rpn family recombination-promoting nuclease/putative transposase [Selenomonadaceae bacterium]
MKTWEELTLSDNFIFQNVMQDPEICKEFLEKLLNISIRNIAYVDLEKIFDVGIESKGIRLDVYVEDDKNSVYDIEMQTTNSPADSLPKRTLYYQSLIVANQIKKGQDYQDLKKTFIIFVCTFDPFGAGRRVYTFKDLCLESRDLELANGSTTIFLNAKGINGDVHKDIEYLLELINGQKAQGDFTKRVETRVDEVKNNDKMKVSYMSWYAEEMRIKRLAQIEGREEGKLDMIKNLLSVKTPIEFIVKASGWTKEKILEIAQSENIAYENN